VRELEHVPERNLLIIEGGNHFERYELNEDVRRRYRASQRAEHGITTRSIPSLAEAQATFELAVDLAPRAATLAPKRGRG
jgi:hypothetical protein